jgi:hypothetical protein
MSCHPLSNNGPNVNMNWKYTSATALSSTHSPTLPISLISLSRRESKKEKARTRVRKWRGRRREGGSSLSRTTRVAMDQDHGLQLSLIPWLAQESLSFHHLEINPRTLTQVSSLAWIDHWDCLVGDPSRMIIKYVVAQSPFLIKVSLGLVSPFISCVS